MAKTNHREGSAAWFRQRLELLVDARKVYRETKGLSENAQTSMDEEILYFQRKIIAADKLEAE